jgi:hypothetical protein
MSQITVTTKEAFREAVGRKVARIRVEGELATKTKLVMRIPAASMTLAAASAGVAIYSFASAHEEVVYAPLTGGVSTGIRFGAGTTATVVLVSLLGPATAWSLVGVGIALGGFGAVKSLRNEYRIQDSGPSFLLLARM